MVALVVTLIDVAGAAPTAVGWKVTDIRQLLCAGSVVPHVVLEIAYGADTVSGEMVNAVVPLLRR